MENQLLHAIANSPAVIHPGRYAYLKLEENPSSSRYFMISQDADEVTAIVEEGQLNGFVFAQSEKWFTRIEFKVNQFKQSVLSRQ